MDTMVQEEVQGAQPVGAMLNGDGGEEGHLTTAAATSTMPTQPEEDGGVMQTVADAKMVGVTMPPTEPVAPADVQMARNPSFTSVGSGGTPGVSLQQSEAWNDPTRLAAFLLARQQRMETLTTQVS
jgi:hypothetical protein